MRPPCRASSVDCYHWARCELRWVCQGVCDRPYCAGLLTEVADDGTEATMEDTTFVLRMADKKTTVRHR